MKKTDFIEKLQKGIYKVTFRKADGTDREMRATLMTEHLPEFKTVTGETVKNYVSGDSVVSQMGTVKATQDTQPTTVRVWDLDKLGWRSFRIDSVESFTKE